MKTLIALLSLCAFSFAFGAEFGETRIRSTQHSVGIEWDLTGDENHNATCQVRYRKSGATEWLKASPLLRIDYRGRYYHKKIQAFRHFNMLAGSVMFLEPGTEYEFELDGGVAKKTVSIATLPIPTPGERLRTFHVVPGDGGGDGSEANPFQGIDAAQNEAKSGDTFLLHAGEYDGAQLTAGGDESRYIVWKAVDDAEVRITKHIEIQNSYVWIEGLTFVSNDAEDFGGVHVSGDPVKGIVVTRNTFRNCRYGLSNPTSTWSGDPSELNTGWNFADNIVEGGPTALYGARVYKVADSDFCYNRITTTLTDKGGDAISLRFCTNVDVYNNDMRDLNDDGVEPDYAYGNIRIFRNRIVNPRWARRKHAADARFAVVCFAERICADGRLAKSPAI